MKKNLLVLLLLPVCSYSFFWNSLGADDLIEIKKNQIEDLQKDIEQLKKRKKHSKKRKQRQQAHLSTQQLGMQLKKDEQGVSIILSPFSGEKVNITKEDDGFSANFDQGALNVEVDDNQLQVALSSQTSVKEKTEHSSFSYSLANYQSNYLSVDQELDLDHVAVTIDTKEKKASITVPFEKLKEQVVEQKDTSGESDK